MIWERRLLYNNKTGDHMVDSSIVNILWTGGWDSTFRIVELSMQDVCIQAIYVKDPKRKSVPYELEAMKKITELIKNKEGTKARFLPLKLIDLEEILQNDEITKAYKFIYEKTKLGSQHEWLARLAADYPGIEIGTEAGSQESSHILKAINMFGVLEKTDGKIVLNKEKSTREGLLVLGNVSFPIIDKTEKDMKDLIEKWGYEDVMQHIWFCHTPINGKPCGICHPCQVKIASKMEFLLPKKSVAKGKIYKLCETCFGEKIATRIFSLLN